MNILMEIAEKRRIDIEKRKKEISIDEVTKNAKKIANLEFKEKESFPFPFKKNLKKTGISFICEVKKASPSKGVIVEDFQYLQIAREYELAGARAVSVLTEPRYFCGKDEYLKEISSQISVPTIRKDFTIDAYQIYEAKVLGASAVLFICSLINFETLKEFLKIAYSVGLSALVEVHNEEEIGQALEAGADIIGVNNRNLETFSVDIMNSVRLRKYVPDNIIYVSESGIETVEDIKRLRDIKTDAVLIGESFMRSKDKKQLFRQLSGEAP